MEASEQNQVAGQTEERRDEFQMVLGGQQATASRLLGATQLVVCLLLKHS